MPKLPYDDRFGGNAEHKGNVLLQETAVETLWRLHNRDHALLDQAMDRLGILDSGDDFERSAAGTAGLEVDIGDALHTLGPGHCCTSIA